MGNAGKNLKEVRKRRGLNQRELAQASGVSLSVIRKLEQGERESARLDTLRKLAAALRVPTMRLSQGPREDGPVVGTVERWEAVRQAIEGPPSAVQADDDLPTLDGVRSTLRTGVALHAAHRFHDLSDLLAPLLHDAEALGAEGRTTRGRVLQLAAGVLVHTRQFDAAEVAIQRALDEATDRMECAATINTQCWLLLRQGKLDTALDLAVHWADEIEPRMSRATPEELSAWGMLLLRVASAAARNNQTGQAEQALRLARGAAATMGREYALHSESRVRSFGPTTVHLKTTEHASVTDRPDIVLRLAERVPFHTVRPSVSNHNRHKLDVADAQAKLRRYGDAMDNLVALRSKSPEWLPNQPYARTVLSRIIEGRRTLTPEMRRMATDIHLEI
ncbi:helix-turn-helix domain-containing protein [Streptomyces uncialis]|uniref:helix-turn-helix domain-containing protein n=1 Tax=Streptomyces uncialis TaxID=1048205 RepID=UPI0037BBE898